MNFIINIYEALKNLQTLDATQIHPETQDQLIEILLDYILIEEDNKFAYFIDNIYNINKCEKEMDNIFYNCTDLILYRR